jgi:pimeloyl-ACP methyl ester carboxylesterase
VLVAAGVALLLLLGSGWMMDAFVRQSLYPAPPFRVPSPPPPPLVEVPLRVDGRLVSAWWLPPARPSSHGARAAALMLHGNGENLETMRQAGTFEELAALGVGVLAVDYPGYGRSEGTPSEAANVAAAEAAWEWLVANHPDGPRVAMGWSLGAAVAAQVAAGRHRASVDGLVLLSPWDSLRSVAALHFPRWLVGLALAERYDTLAAAPRVGCPSLVVHGEGDAIIPAELGRRVAAALPEPKRWLAVPGAGHNDLLAREEPWQAIAELVARLGEPRAPAAP